MRINEVLEKKNTGNIYSSFDDIEKIKSECSDAWNSFINDRVCLYRGCSQSDSMLEVNPQNGTRKSAGTSNYYTVAMSQLPAFSNFPRRDKSLICATKMNVANVYSKLGGVSGLYVVFPINGTRLGVSQHEDVWDSKLKNPQSTFNDKTIIGISAILAKHFDRVCLPSVKEQLNLENRNNLIPLYKDFIDHFTPEDTGMLLMDTKEFYSNFSAEKSVEVWFSDKAYMMNFRLKTEFAGHIEDFCKLDNLTNAQLSIAKKELQKNNFSEKELSDFLFMAVNNKSYDMVKLLIGNGALVNKVDEDGYPPIWYAIVRGDFVMVELLISLGVDLSVKNHGHTVYDMAIGIGYPAIASHIKRCMATSKK